MRVINISSQDYANYSYEISESMKLVGIDADSYVLKPHPFGYRHQATRVNLSRMKNLINSAEVIMVMHSDEVMYSLLSGVKKPVIVWHTGTRYRQAPARYNAMWNERAVKVVCCLGEFMTMGCKNPEYFNMTVDTNELLPVYNLDKFKPILFGHFPSNPKVKGTEVIRRIFERVDADNYPVRFQIDEDIIPHTESLNRMRKVDVYVEMMAPTQNGKPYGSFGTTALEAAALGKVVITNNMHQLIYQKYYGGCSMHICNSEKIMEDTIRILANFSRPELNTMQQFTRDWVESHHSRTATGMRIMNLFRSIPEINDKYL